MRAPATITDTGRSAHGGLRRQGMGTWAGAGLRTGRAHFHASRAHAGGSGIATPGAPSSAAGAAFVGWPHDQPLADLFTAIDHVGVAVSDLDAAIAFYRDTYGMTLMHEEINEEQGVREAMMAVGDVRLVHPAARPALAGVDHRQVPRPQRARVSSRSPTGSPTSTPCRDACASGACACSMTPRAAAPPDSRVNFIHPKDAGGILVELVEPATSAGH